MIYQHGNVNNVQREIPNDLEIIRAFHQLICTTSILVTELFALFI